MGFTAIVALGLLLFIAVVFKMVILEALREKNMIKAAAGIVILVLGIGIVFYSMIFFITSM